MFKREKEGRVYHAPVIMAKAELSSVYMKLVMHQLGFTDEEIDVRVLEFSKLPFIL